MVTRETRSSASEGRVFLNAPLSTLAEQRLNDVISSLVVDLGFTCYSPQEKIPPGSSLAPAVIFEENRRAVDESDIILCVLDKPGLGVVFELGYALAQGKTIVAFRSDQQDYLGKVLEGLWERLDTDRKATTLDRLREILSQLREPVRGPL